MNAVTTDTHLGVSLSQGDWVRAGFDITALVFGVAMCLVWRRLTVPEPRASTESGAKKVIGREALNKLGA